MRRRTDRHSIGTAVDPPNSPDRPHSGGPLPWPDDQWAGAWGRRVHRPWPGGRRHSAIGAIDMPPERSRGPSSPSGRGGGGGAKRLRYRSRGAEAGSCGTKAWTAATTRTWRGALLPATAHATADRGTRRPPCRGTGITHRPPPTIPIHTPPTPFVLCVSQRTGHDRGGGFSEIGYHA